MNFEPMKYCNFRKFHHFLVKIAKFQSRIVCRMCACPKILASFPRLTDDFFTKPGKVLVSSLLLPHQEAKTPNLVQILHIR